MIQPYDISLKENNFFDFITQNMGGKPDGDFFLIASEPPLQLIGLCSFYHDNLDLRFYFKWTMSIEKNPRYPPFRIGTRHSEQYVSKEFLFDFLKKNHPEQLEWILFNQDIFQA
jgi:hypothetical protein